MSSHAERLAPVGGPFWTPTTRALAGVSAAAAVAVLVRFAVGIGPTTALNDGYSWGLWKIFNVIVLTALGSGGYAVALLVYVLGRGRYHGIARIAILTSALGYTSAILALAIDVGRPWNMWRMAEVTRWNLHSVLLEIAVCVSAYLVFLWLEFAPTLLEGLRRSAVPWRRRAAARAQAGIRRNYAWIVAFAIVLPTMHQSSLGALFLLAGPRLHPLWQTPLLPLFFLLSCWAIGYATVVGISLLASRVWRRPVDLAMHGALARVTAWVLLAFAALRLADLVLRGQLPAAFALDWASGFFLAETTLLLLGALLLLVPNVRSAPAALFRALLAIVAGGALYRLNAALIGFMPGEHWAYFPSLTETLITLGLVTAAALGFLWVVRHFPILSAAE